MKKKFILIILLIVFLAIFSRLILLDLRPLHADEGVNYFFAEQILHGNGFIYNPTNFHGPFYFFILAASFFIFGISEFSLRFPAALFGIILVSIPLFLIIKTTQRIKFSILILLSPSILFYSRYSIHEISFLLFCFLCFYFLNKIIEEKTLKSLPFLAFFLALAFTTKETSIIFSFTLLFIIIFNLKSIKEIQFKREQNRVFVSFAIFVLVWILLFSSFFTNFAGIRGSVEAFSPWTKTGVGGAGHEKSYDYFAKLMMKYELPILLLSIVSIYLYFRKKEKDVLFKNSIIWFVSALIIYSLIPYKTPWLVVNMVLPALLLASFALERIKFRNVVFVITMIYLISFSFYLNFIVPWQPQNEFAYVHTDKDILSLVNSLDSQASLGSRILVNAKDYWPLPFYLDNYEVYYQDTAFNKSYLKNFDFAIVQENLYKNYSNQKLYTLRDNIKLMLVKGQ